MAEEKDPFEEYYEETAGKTGGEGASELLANMEKQAEEKLGGGDIPSDAAKIKAPINAFIKKLNAVIGEVFRTEEKSGIRPDLLVTLVVGGLAFAAANVYYLFTRNKGLKMTAEEYETTFVGMFRTAIKDIGKDKE